MDVEEKGHEDLNDGVPVSSEATTEENVIVDEVEDDEGAAKDAKISELTNHVAALESTIALKDGEIQKWKAKNFDLLMMMPNTDSGNESESEDDDADDEGGPEEKTGAAKLFNIKE